MTRDTKERLEDIRDAVQTIQAHIGGRSVSQTWQTNLYSMRVLFNFLVIGEAAKSLDEDLRGMAPEVPWADFAGLRDIIAHRYFRVQKQIIEDTIRKDLPMLQLAVDRLIGQPQA